MGIHTYVARKYDVEFQVVGVHWGEFDEMFYALLELSQDESSDLPEITYCTDDDNNWYEIDKGPLEEMLAYLKSLGNINGTLLDSEQKKVCPAKYIDWLEELLAPVGKDLDILRVEFE